LRHDSSRGKRSYLGHATRLQRPGARVERRAGGAHIVHQHDNGSVERSRVPRGRERVADVSVTPCRRQADLSGRRANAPQRLHDRETERSCQVGSLIESALAAPGRVERDRDRAGRAGEDVRPAFAHQRGEWGGQRAAAVVFQRVDDGAKRAVVGADRAGAIDSRSKAPASRTQ